MHRNWVGKRVCQSADRVREGTVAVVDTLWGEDYNTAVVMDTKEAVLQVAESLKDLDAAVKDWEQIQQVPEDSSIELQWRREASETCKQVVAQLGADLDQIFPENGRHRILKTIYSSRGGSVGERAGALGPFTKQILTRISIQEDKPAVVRKSSSSASVTTVSTTETGFTWEHQEALQRLELKWTRLFKVSLRFNSDMEITAVRIVSDNGKDVWPSAFDVFRSMEREARKELHVLKYRTEAITQDEVNARFIAWLARYRAVFHRKCSVTKRYFACGGVGREGQLEARPPLVNKGASNIGFSSTTTAVTVIGGTGVEEDRVVFQPNLI